MKAINPPLSVHEVFIAVAVTWDLGHSPLGADCQLAGLLHSAAVCEIDEHIPKSRQQNAMRSCIVYIRLRYIFRQKYSIKTIVEIVGNYEYKSFIKMNLSLIYCCYCYAVVS